MITKIIAHGEETVILIDKSMLKLLNITMDTPLKSELKGDV